MTMKELMKKTPKQLDELSGVMLYRGNMAAVLAIDCVKKYAHKRVRVVKGRKVPHGTEGECFWMGSYCNSPYGDPWGIYTTFRCGIRDDSGGVHWTALDNVELCGEGGELDFSQTSAGIWESADRRFAIEQDGPEYTALALRPDGKYEAFPGFETFEAAVEFIGEGA